MNWAIFLHFYQPSNQKKQVIDDVVNTAYRPILSLIDRYPNARVSLNINACLTEQLSQHGINDVLDLLKKLAKEGKIEFVASSKNHVFLPLVPEYEIELEIKQGLDTNREILGEVYQPRGFFPTELAVSHKVAKVVNQQGFDYLLADEISFDGGLSDQVGLTTRTSWWSKLYQVAGAKDLVAFFSNRSLCDLIRATPDLDVSRFQAPLKTLTAGAENHEQAYLVSANDAEAFGHHWPSRHEILKWAFDESESQESCLITLGSLLTGVKAREKIELLKGTWETSVDDFQNKRPFSLWHDPANPIQQSQWKLAWKAIESLHRAKKRGEDPQSEAFLWARRHLTRGLHSCYFWWSSCKPWWNPDMIVEGAQELIRVTRTLNSLDPEEKSKVEEDYVTIIRLVWQWHWGGEAERRINQFHGHSNSITDSTALK